MLVEHSSSHHQMFCLPVSQMFSRFRRNKRSNGSSSDPSESFVFGLLSTEWSAAMDKENQNFGPSYDCAGSSRGQRAWDTYQAYYPERPFVLERALTTTHADTKDLKHYLLIVDKQTRTKRLAIIQSLSHNVPSNIEAANELLHELRHAYISPILYLDVFAGHSACVVLPFTNEGTLSQLIARLRRQVDSYSLTPTTTMVRSSFMTTSLVAPISTSLVNIYSIHEKAIRRFGRQILEALVFLHGKGFLPYGRFTSNDIIIQNGTARLTGIESVFLRSNCEQHHMSRLSPDEDILSVGTPKASIDTISFGHLFWEMADGHRLDTPRPCVGELVTFQRWPLLFETFKKIFAIDNKNGDVRNYPQIEEIMTYKLFAVDLREMPSTFNRVYKDIELSSEAELLIEEVGLKRQPDPRLAARSSFDIYFTPPSTPHDERRTTHLASNYDDSYDWPDMGSTRRRGEQIKSGVDHRGRLKLQTNVFSEVRVFSKFRRDY